MTAQVFGLLSQQWKPPVLAATTSPLPSNTYTAGNLVATANGALTVDGVAVPAAARVLVAGETAGANNGIYTVTQTGSGSSPYVLTRAPDMTAGFQVPGSVVLAEAGTAYAGALFFVAGSGPFTIGTTAISWILLTVASAQTGMTGWINLVREGASPVAAAPIDSLWAAAFATGQPVYLQAGRFASQHPLLIPPGGVLICDPANEVSTYLDGLFGAVIQPMATWSQGSSLVNAVVAMVGQPDVTPNYATVSVEQKIFDLMIDAHLLPGTAATGTNSTDGICLYGNVGRARFERVLVAHPPNCGINYLNDGGGNGPDAPYWFKSTVRYAGNATWVNGTGVNAAPQGYGVCHTKISDATYDQHLCENCYSDGYNITNASNGKWLATRSEHNGNNGVGNGYTWICTQDSAGSGGCIFDAVSSDRNEAYGMEIYSTNASGVPLILKGDFRRDGRNGNSGGGGLAGVYVHAFPGTVMLDVNIEPGVDDNNTGTPSPEYGLKLASNSGTETLVLGPGSYIQGASQAISDDGSAAYVDLSPSVQATGTTSGETFGLPLTAGGVLTLWPTGDTTGAADTQKLLNALGLLTATTGSGRIVLAAGTFYITCGQITVTTPGIYIDGVGINATYISAVGSGDVFDYHFTGTYSGKTTVGGGGKNYTILGANCTASIAYTATNASPAVFTATASNLAAGQPVVLSGGSAPSGFTNGTIYYAVSPTANTFELSATPFGTAINSSSTGNGNVLPGSCGIHAGDIESLSFTDVYIRDFNAGQASIGLHLDNRYYFTERLHLDVHSDNNYNAVVFDVSDNPGGSPQSSSASFARVDAKFHITQNNASYNGVVLANGALPYGVRMQIRGNFTGSGSPLTANPYSAANSPAVLTIAGRTPAGHPNAGSYSRMFSVLFDVDVECSAAAHTPQTIVLDAVGNNNVRGWLGTLDFDAATKNFTASNMNTGANSTRGPNAFWGFGAINGDSTLSLVTSGSDSPMVQLTQTMLYAQGSANINSGGGTLDCYIRDGDFIRFNPLSGNYTINLNPGGTWAGTSGAPQRITIILTQASSGGPYTVTWPVNASPTTASPTVIWAGGVTPVMSPGAGAVDVYFLETYNGATWYGRALQATPTQPSPMWLPGDNGLLQASSDPLACRDTTLMIAGSVYLFKLTPRYAYTVADLVVDITGAGSGASTGSFAGIYSSSGGAPLSGSSDIGSLLTSGGEAALPLTTPQAVVPGSYYYLALLANLASTQPTLLGTASQGTPKQPNLGLSGATLRYAINGTGQTSLPNLTLSSNANANAILPWWGVK